MLGGQGNTDDLHPVAESDPFEGCRFASSNPKRAWGDLLDRRRSVRYLPSVYGRFVDGVGEFRGEDTHDGIPVDVRFIWSRITPTSAKWEQVFSIDGGAT